MAEDRIDNSNFSNIRAVTPLLLRNSDKTIIWSYILSISFIKFSLSLSLSTWMICSPVFRVKSFDIDNIICII